MPDSQLILFVNQSIEGKSKPNYKSIETPRDLGRLRPSMQGTERCLSALIKCNLNVS